MASVISDVAPSLLWAGLASILASIVGALFVWCSYIRTIRKLRDITDRASSGDYEYAASFKAPADFRGLAAGIDRMAIHAKTSNERLRYFVADVSHQLRNPLTSIRGFAQAILDGTAGDSESVKKAADIIKDETQRMLRQVEQLLELARMQSGQVQMKRDPFNLNELFEHCVEIFAFQADEKGLQIEMSMAPLPPVIGDIDRREHVFVNLLDNSIKHSPTGKPVIISGKWLTPDAVEIKIADSGPGIPQEELIRVFERFYRADDGTIGTGLGLAIAREIVVAHGGEIKVSSQPGEGTEFAVLLPTGPRNVGP